MEEKFIPEKEIRPEVEKETLRKILKDVYSSMKENKIYAVRALVKDNVYDLELEEERFFKEVSKHREQRFWVFEGAHPEERSLLFKIRIGKDPYHEVANEISFYQDIKPYLERNISEQTKELIEIPELKIGSKKDKYLITSFADGELAGDIYELKSEEVNSAQLGALIDFIKAVEDINFEKLNELSPEIQLEEATNPIEIYPQKLEARKERLEKILGKEYYQKMEALLPQKLDILRRPATIFSNHDINTSNIIVTRQGKLSLIDWERLKKVHDHATAYGFLYVNLWSNPELQDRFLEKVLEKNKDNPNFKEHLRLELTFFRLSGIMSQYYYPKIENKDLPKNEREKARKAVERLSYLQKQILDKKGIWSD